MSELKINRELRRTRNSKENKAEIVKTRPSINSLREGQEVLHIDKQGKLGRYRKQNGLLWVSYMSPNGNHIVDKNLHIKGNLTVDGDSNISGGGSGDITGVDLTQGTGIAITSETNTESGDYSSTISCDLEGVELGSNSVSGTTYFLRADGDNTCSWQVPPDTTYSNFTGDSGSGGASGLVPAPGSGDASAGKYLDSDGSWTVPPDTDTNTNQLTTWTLRDDDDDSFVINQGKFLKVVAATGALGTDIAGSGTTGDPWKLTITSPDTTTNTMGSGFILAATTDTNSGGTIVQSDTLTFGAGDGIKCETTGSDTVTTSIRSDMETSLGDLLLKGQVASTDYAKISVNDTGATTAGTGLKIYAGGPATSSNTNEGTEECTLTNGSNNITPGTAAISYLAIGQLVTGTGITANSRIISLGGTASFNISKPATATGTQNLTFYTTNIVNGGDLDFYSGVTQGSGTSKMTFNISTSDEDGTTVEALVLEEDPKAWYDGYKTLRPSIDAGTAGACSLGTSDEEFERLHVKDIWMSGQFQYLTENTLFTVSSESGSDNLSGGGTLQVIGGDDIACVTSQVSGTVTKVAIDIPANIGHTGNMTSIVLSDLLTAKNIHGIAGQNMVIKNANTTDTHGKALTIQGGSVTDTGSGNYNPGGIIFSSGDGHGTGSGNIYFKIKKSGVDAADYACQIGADPSDLTKYALMSTYNNGCSLGNTSYKWTKLWASAADINGSTDINGTLTQDGGNVVFNEDSADYDFRVEANGNTHALFVEGNQGFIGIGCSTPGYVNGNDHRGGNVAQSDGSGGLLHIEGIVPRIILDDTGDNPQYAIEAQNYFAINELDNASTAATTRLYINDSGNIGLGQTPGTTARLWVKHTGMSRIARFFNDGGDSGYDGINVECGHVD